MIKVPLFLRIWIPIAISITALCLLVYASVQQNYRQSANDPQIQISEDLANNLNNGKNIDLLVSKEKIDISKSLAIYVMVFDNNGNVLSSSAILEGKDPKVPVGVLSYAKKYNQDRLTWQPKENVRSAIVVTKYNSGYVLVGRSIREIEKREDQIFVQAELIWVGTMLATLIAVLVFV